MKKVFITGSHGYLGKAVVNLIEQDLNTNLILHDRVNFPFNNINKIKELLRDCDVVIHMAGLKKGSQEDLVEANMSSTTFILQALDQLNKKDIRFIFASSFALYHPNDNKINEESRIDPVSFYGQSKLKAEEVIREYAEKGVVSALLLRISNIYGPNEQKGNASVVKIFVDQIRDNLDVTVNGEGKQVRDFIYVEDVAYAFQKSLCITNKNSHDAINICSGQGVSMNELVEAIGSSLNKKPTIVYNKEVPDESVFVGDNTKAEKVLNWNPMTSFKEGLEKSIK
jgi:nucleoside-diphosphate-sugar epimerase